MSRGIALQGMSIEFQLEVEFDDSIPQASFPQSRPAFCNLHPRRHKDLRLVLLAKIKL